ncbi:MAG: hypothetical protein IJU40_06485, partial [Desulfovibrionaceae bacterium]|nr:hypothetical protein [Desulfovibrionaceae bacterium]
VIDNPPKFLPYASHYIAMIMGSDFCKTYDKVTIENFAKCKDYLEENFLKLYLSALNKITLSLEDLYKDVEKLSLQQLASTFRRGDLIKTLLRN